VGSEIEAIKTLSVMSPKSRFPENGQSSVVFIRRSSVFGEFGATGRYKLGVLVGKRQALVVVGYAENQESARPRVVTGFEGWQWGVLLEHTSTPTSNSVWRR
jgi:hypothetical protein